MTEKPLPKEIFVVWENDTELRDKGMLQAVEADPRKWFGLPHHTQTYGVYQLVRVKKIPRQGSK